jgi:hypothetical protein
VIKLFHKAKKESFKPVEKRFCSKGHEVPLGTARYLALGNIYSDWLCPQCLIDLVNANASITGVKKQGEKC